MGIVVFVSVCVTCYRPECPLHSAQGPRSWPGWWSLQGSRPIGQNGGHCPASRSRPHMVCTAAWPSLNTSQPDRRKLWDGEGERVTDMWLHTQRYEHTQKEKQTFWSTGCSRCGWESPICPTHHQDCSSTTLCPLTHTHSVLTAVCSSGRRWKVWAGAWIERDGDPPSWPSAVTLCVLVVVVCLQNTYRYTHRSIHHPVNHFGQNWNISLHFISGGGKINIFVRQSYCYTDAFYYNNNKYYKYILNFW